MRTINIVGTGNVAWHLATAIKGLSHYKLQSIAGRSDKAIKNYQDLQASFCLIQELRQADITLIAVSDDAVHQVSKTIPYDTGLFAHTSGSVALDALSHFEHYGVLYPLQSFSKKDSITFKEIPICIEVAIESDIGILENLALALSKKVTRISSSERAQLHLAAVFANNFTNHCFTMAQELCEKHKLSFDLLKPLIVKTVNKAILSNPVLSQTGPAKRNDTQTINRHLNLLENPNYKEVYTTMSKAITTYYEQKL